MNRSRFLAATVAASVVLATGVAHAQQRVRFQLDWRLDGQTAPFFMGNCKGHYKAEGLDVQLDAGAGSALAVTRVASGAYDMGFGDTSSLIEFASNNQGNPNTRVRAVYITYESTPAGILMLKKAGINKPSDLNGRTLGAPGFDAGRKLFPLFARANGIDITKVKWETMEPRLREQMLAKGQVEAITGFVASSMISLNEVQVRDQDIAVFNYKDFGVKVYGNAILANERFIRENPKAIASFLRAYNNALKDTLTNPVEAIKCLKAREPIIDDVVELKRLKSMMQYVATPGAISNGLGIFDKIRLESQVDDVMAAFALKVRPDPESLFDSSFLPDRSARRISGIDLSGIKQ